MNAALRYPKIEPYAAIRAPRVSRGFSESRQPPDPGSAHTNNTRNSQILFVDRSTDYNRLNMMPNNRRD